jgi:protein required for attachment to host cells
MDSTCVVVADATRARLFLYRRQRVPGEDISESFAERTDLVDPARRQRPVELFSDSRPGSSRADGRQFAFDDHRGHHVDELDAEFAREIAHAVDELVRETRVRRVVMCASTTMLGPLRHALIPLERAGIAVTDLGRDLVMLSPSALRAQLAAYALLPAVPRRAGAGL